MKLFLTLAAVLQVTVGGFVSVRMPYQNPAGVTYLSGQYQGHEFPGGYASSYSSSGISAPYSQYQQQQYQQPLQYQQSYQYQQPLQYQQAYRYAAAPVATGYPAKIEAHHVGYAAAQVPAVAAVPFVKHVPTVSHIPVTRYEAQPAVIEKQVDVAKPAVSTRKFEVRRPAIQKQFYDIEERVIIRPAGSAVVELEEPTSKLQRGPAVVQSLEAHNYAAATHNLVAQAASFAHGPSSQSSIPIIAHAPVHVTVAPVISHHPVSHIQSSPSTPAPVVDESSGESQQSGSESSDDQAVVVDNVDFRNAQFRGSSFGSTSSQSFTFGARIQGSEQQQQQQQQQQFAQRNSQATYGARNQGSEQQQQQFTQGNSQAAYSARNQESEQQQQQQQQQQLEQQQQQQQFSQRNSQDANTRQSSVSSPNILVRSNGVDLNSPAPRFAAHDYNPSSPSVIPSIRNSPEESKNNQQRLIDLLTARGGVAEVGFGRDGGASSSVGDAGHVRARVISATPAPEYAEAAGERVSTRRVVVSRPIETLQEVDVVEPATKYERVSVQHPTFIKTAHLDHVQVHGSIPVVGKAYTPAVAHAAVPVYQKTISPAYGF